MTLENWVKKKAPDKSCFILQMDIEGALTTHEEAMTPVRLNLGCGAVTPPAWTNVDYALGARLLRWPLLRRLGLFNLEWDRRVVIHDLLKRFPWADDSVHVIYCSHMLEHFDREQGERFLRECRRVLRPDGVIRIVVPDLSVYVRRYSSGELKAECLLEEMDVLFPVHRSPLKRLLAPFVSYPHKCMYDREALLRVMRKVGFECEEREPFSSMIADIRTIELESRTTHAVIAEGVPAGT
jgi:predicted SAM-dependent methyltransferase